MSLPESSADTPNVEKAKDKPSNPGIDILVPRPSNLWILLVNSIIHKVYWSLMLQLVRQDQPRETRAYANHPELSRRKRKLTWVNRPAILEVAI